VVLSLEHHWTYVHTVLLPVVDFISCIDQVITMLVSTRTTWTLWYKYVDYIPVAAADVAVFAVGTAGAALANDLGSGSSRTQKYSRTARHGRSCLSHTRRSIHDIYKF
jgi:hypothetical protein